VVLLGTANKYAVYTRPFMLRYLPAILLIGVVISDAETLAQSREATLTVFARDHYTEAPLDSVTVSLLDDEGVVAMVMTNDEGRGVLIFAITRVEEAAPPVSRFSLSSNYPNPFSDETRLDLTLPNAQRIALSVYNVAGQRIASGDAQLEAGVYTLRLVLASVPDGLYFVRVEGNQLMTASLIKVGRSRSQTGVGILIESGNPSPALVAQSSAMGMLSEARYLLRAERDRYLAVETAFTAPVDTVVHIPLSRQNRVVFTTGLEAQRTVQVSGDDLKVEAATAEMLILPSGIYQVTAGGNPPIDQMLEVASVDTMLVLHPLIPASASVSGRVGTEALEVLPGAQIALYREGALLQQVSAGAEGQYLLNVLADGGQYALVASAPADGVAAGGPLFGNQTRLIRPRPSGAYVFDFVLYAESELHFPTGRPDSLTTPYSLVNSDGSVILSEIPPDLGIVGGSARAFSPSGEGDAFPGEFATRQEGLESGLISGGFVSVNLLREAPDGAIEPVSALKSAAGDPVQIRLRFRFDPADWHVIRDPEGLTHLPGFRNRPDTLDVPLYYFDEAQGDWLLAAESGWLESARGVVPPGDLQAIQDGSFDGELFVVGDVDHFSWYNLDYPSRDACIRGRLLDQLLHPVANKKVVFRSMPGGHFTPFSNVIEATTDEDGYFRIRVPRSETGPDDDWNRNRRVDTFGVTGLFEDKDACEAATLDNNGRGYTTPMFPETSGCRSIGSIRVELRQAKKQVYEVTFVDAADNSRKLTISPASVQFPEFAYATLLDPRVPLMGPVWNCACKSDTSFGECKFQSTMDDDGKARFTIPVLNPSETAQVDVPAVLTGGVRYRKLRPDLGEFAHERGSRDYFVAATEKKPTVPVEVVRVGPPRVQIVRVTSEVQMPDSLANAFAADEQVTLEAKAQDVNGASIDAIATFYWSGSNGFIGYGRTFTGPARRLFGEGPAQSVTAHAVHLGYEGIAHRTGLIVSSIPVTITASPIAGVTTTRFTFGTSGFPKNTVSYEWDFGDGTSASGPTVEHTYSRPDTFVVRVTIGDGSGGVGFAARRITTTGAPGAAFVVSVDPATPGVVTFDGSSSISPEDALVAWRWDFGDGANGEGQTVVHSYSRGGSLRVRLTVEDDKGRTAFATKTVEVSLDECPSPGGSKTITTMEEFMALGSECGIDGDLVISSIPEVPDLSPLGGILSISGLLSIGAMPDLETLHGLEGLRSVGDLRIVNNGVLTSLEALQNLRRATSVTVQNNVRLLAFDGLGQLQEVEGDFTIGLNTAMSDISGLQNLERIGGELKLINNIGIESIGGFRRLTSVGGLRIISNSRLTSLGSLPLGLTGDISWLEIRDNRSLLSINGFDFVTDVEHLLITSNRALERIEGFSQLKSSSFDLNISFNDALEAIAGFNSLKSINSLRVGSNQVLAGDLSFLDNIAGEANTITIGANPLLTGIGRFAALTRIAGNLTVNHTAMTVFDAFPLLERIDGSLFMGFNTVVSHCELIRFREGIYDSGGIGGTSSVSNNGNWHTGSITISSPADIVPFEGICGISGTLSVVSSSVTNLAGLDSLMTVWTLDIRNNQQLESLEGLHNLASASNVSIQSNSVLPNLNGLRGLREVWSPTIFDGNMSIGGNASMTSLGLDRLAHVQRGFGVGGQALVNLTGLSSLRRAGSMTISGTGTIQRIDPWSSIEYLGSLTLTNLPGIIDMTFLSRGEIESLSLLGLPDLAGLEGLEFLSSMKGNLFVRSCPSLTSLAGLDNLVDVGGGLHIVQNNALSTLNGLDRLVSVRTSFNIQSNPELESLQALSSLATVGHMDIASNQSLSSLEGLDNLRDANSVSINSLPELVNLTGLASLSEVRSWLAINNTGVSSLHGMETLRSVAGWLQITNNTTLTNLAGLEDITEVGELHVTSNSSLTGLEGLASLASAGAVRIENNPSLVSLSALAPLKNVEKRVVIRSNGMLTDLQGLDNVTVLGDSFDLEITDNPLIASLNGLNGLNRPIRNVVVARNASLKSLEGLGGLTMLTGDLTISSNDSLATLTGLHQLTSLQRLRLSGNPRLAVIDLPDVTSLRELWVEDNTSLQRISSMRSLRRIDQTLLVRENGALPSCDVLALRDQVQGLDGIGGSIIIEGNDDAGVCEPV
jgi:PKD repeat protein